MKFKKILITAINSIVITIIIFFSFKVISTLILAPILSFYSSAYNFWSITGDASYFKLASDMTSSWLFNIVMLCLGILAYKIIKIRGKIKLQK